MIYDFDEADPELSLLPMASRRALDAAGLKLSLAGYQSLAHAQRVALVRAGAGTQVDLPATLASVALALPAAVPQAAWHEPVDLPAALASELELSAEIWARLSALDRYVLDKLQRRGKRERLLRAFAEILSRHA